MAQLVALMVALLFTGQSVLVETPCTQWLHAGNGHTLGCGLMAPSAAENQLTADCHAPRLSAPGALECNQSGCNMATVQVVAQASTAPKSKAGSIASFAAIREVYDVPASVQAMRSARIAPAPGPARYLLFQVFRI
jgi:hypothetical protein